MSDDLMMPTQGETDVKEKSRIKVWFYLDTSGSCAHLGERFFKAAESLPPDRFDIKLFCFDTRVYATTLVSRKLYGFGGTRFDIIEQHIQQEIISKQISHPAAIFVISDGYGNRVNPEFCKKWYWFLSQDYRHCIPNECNVYLLKDFE